MTGSNDIGIMFAKSGCLTHVHTFVDGFVLAPDPTGPAADIVILDTNSRLDRPEVAYRKVFAATKVLKALGCRRFFNKTCSAFRGNIGAEFDAMLDALGLDFSVVVLGFPKTDAPPSRGFTTSTADGWRSRSSATTRSTR